jgi:selenocysteine lyase/cysteine desulfurase
MPRCRCCCCCCCRRGARYGRNDWLQSLPARKVRPATDELPTDASYQLSRWEKGTLPFESIAGAAAAIDYLAWIGERFGGAPPAPADGVAEGGKLAARGAATDHGGAFNGSNRRARLTAGFEVIEAHEHTLGRRFLAGVEELPGLELCGLSSYDDGVAGGGHRCPTFALRAVGSVTVCPLLLRPR